MELRQLRYFVAVAEELHFRRAAARLHISQPPLSQQIGALEAELGVRLLERTRRRVELTAAGEAFLRDARATLAELDAAVSTARAVGAGQAGLLRVSFVGSALLSIVPAAVQRFRRSRPGVEIELRERSTAEQLRALSTGVVDVALVRPPIQSDIDLHLQEVMREHTIAAIPEDHELAQLRRIPVKRLAAEPLVLFPRAQAPGYHDQLIGRLAATGTTPARRPVRPGDDDDHRAGGRRHRRLAGAGLGGAPGPRRRHLPAAGRCARHRAGGAHAGGRGLAAGRGVRGRRPCRRLTACRVRGVSGRHRLDQCWKEDRPAFGLWGSIPSPLTAELAAAAGFDYVCVDLQHGGADEERMVAMFTAIEARGAVPLARVLYNEPWMVNRVLDLGAAGVIVPLVGTAAEARRAVSGCRYPPHGMRSYGPLRAALTVGATDPERLAAGALCFVMVETREGLDHVEEIAATPGLDGIYIGPSDLSIGLRRDPGHGGDVLERAIDRIAQACQAAGIVAGMHCNGGGEEARARAQAGFRMVTVGVDASLFRARIGEELAAARA